MYLASQAHNMNQNYLRRKEDKYYAHFVKKISRKISWAIRFHRNRVLVNANPRHDFQMGILEEICKEYKEIGYGAFIRAIDGSDKVKIDIHW